MTRKASPAECRHRKSFTRERLDMELFSVAPLFMGLWGLRYRDSQLPTSPEKFASLAFLRECLKPLLNVLERHVAAEGALPSAADQDHGGTFAHPPTELFRG